MPECRTFRRGISFEQRSFEFAAAVDYALTPGRPRQALRPRRSRFRDATNTKMPINDRMAPT